jgi:hypothetical protein
MNQDDLFLSLNQILQDHFHEFPRAELLNEPVDTVRHALWNLVQNSDLSTVQFVAVWCEYAHAKQVDLNHHGEYYFGLDKNVFVTLSKKDLISVSLKALKNGLEQHLEFINLWKESCHQIHEQDGNEQETEKDTGDEPRESEDEVASVSTRASSRTIGRIRELPTLAPGQAVARRSLAPKKKHSSRKRPLPKSQDEDQSSPRKRGRPQKYPRSPESAAKMPKSLSPTKIARPRKNSMSKSSTTKPEDKDHDAVTAIAVTPSLKTHAPGTARLQVRSDDDPSSSRSSKRLIKPRNRFDPCNGNGRLWSEAGQPIRKIPEHALMKKSTGRKRSNRIFDIAERATKKGVFTPKSLWKYICPNDNKSYIVEIVNAKGVRSRTVEVAYRGYGSKCRVPVESLQVPTDKDFDTFEADFLYARQVAKESRSRRYGASSRK